MPGKTEQGNRISAAPVRRNHQRISQSDFPQDQRKKSDGAGGLVFDSDRARGPGRHGSEADLFGQSDPVKRANEAEPRARRFHQRGEAAKGNHGNLAARIGLTALHVNAPIKVPSVFVKRSVVPESRVGRYACRISMVRLTRLPRMTVASAARFTLRADKQAQKQKPNGMNPTMFLK